MINLFVEKETTGKQEKAFRAARRDAQPPDKGPRPKWGVEPGESLSDQKTIPAQYRFDPDKRSEEIQRLNERYN